MPPTPSLADRATRQWFVDAAATLGAAINERQLDQFATMLALLTEWNSRINLTAITDPATMLTRHLLDSLTCLVACADVPAEARVEVVDIGSGPGLPGLALAVARPAWHVRSVEATAKKVHFQDAAIAAMGLTNAIVAHGRAEELARDPAWRGRFAVVTARAVAALPTLLEWSLPFVASAGRALALKKGDLGAELAQGRRAATLLGGGVPTPMALPAGLRAFAPELDDGRCVVVTRRVTATPARFPRPGAASMKTPLGGVES